MQHRFAFLLAGGVAACLAAPAHATYITNNSLTTVASLSAPVLDPARSTVIATRGISTPSQQNFSAADNSYSVSFQNVSSQNGVVSANTGGPHRIPVAGISANGWPTYLTGDYGSPQTTQASQSGNYFSTGGASAIAFNWAMQQSSLSLLWGSVDSLQWLEFLNDGKPVGTISGVDVKNAANWNLPFGAAGYLGSAYVTVTSALGFDKVVARSHLPSFEFTAMVSQAAPTDVPEPASIAVLAAALLAFGVVCWPRIKGGEPGIQA